MEGHRESHLQVQERGLEHIPSLKPQNKPTCQHLDFSLPASGKGCWPGGYPKIINRLQGGEIVWGSGAWRAEPGCLDVNPSSSTGCKTSGRGQNLVEGSVLHS